MKEIEIKRQGPVSFHDKYSFRPFFCFQSARFSPVFFIKLSPFEELATLKDCSNDKNYNDNVKENENFTWLPVHLVTWSPGHLVTWSPCDLVT